MRGLQFIKQEVVKSYKSVISNLILIVSGSIVFVIGLNSVLVPKGLLNGGVMGTAILVHYLVPLWQIGVYYFLLNIPLIIIGWFYVSRRFMIYSIIGMTCISVAASVIHPPVIEIKDPILAALLAGVFCGAGTGITLRSFGSGGGSDILAVYLNKKFGFRLGTIYFAANAVVLVAGAYLYSVELTLYSIIFLFVSGKVMDAVLTGFNMRKSLMVISDHAESIASAILEREGRGVTFLKGEGAFTKTDKKVIFTITSLTELPKIKDIILSQDPEAFVVINDTLEVLGKRHGRGRVY